MSYPTDNMQYLGHNMYGYLFDDKAAGVTINVGPPHARFSGRPDPVKESQDFRRIQEEQREANHRKETKRIALEWKKIAAAKEARQFELFHAKQEEDEAAKAKARSQDDPADQPDPTKKAASQEDPAEKPTPTKKAKPNTQP